MTSGDKILITPLDWGLGHATRCVPLINFLISQKTEVIIAGNGKSLLYLKERFPELQFREISTSSIKYSTNGMISAKFALSMLKFALNVRKEHRDIERIVREENIKYIFSDNRLGAYSKSATSFYMTHQYNFDNGFLGKIPAFFMKKIHNRHIKKFNFCCIPDAEGQNSLSGILSKTELSPIHLGPLSRFYGQQFHAESADFDLLILSGIEPQRSILEQIFIQKYSSQTRKLVIIRGFDISTDQSGKYDNISFITNPSDNEFANLALSASRIFCRSGYSTVCDLAALKRRAILIPTPRQPEQEYLAVHLNKNFGFPYITQKDLAKNNFQEINYETQWNFDYICNFNNIFNDKF